MTSTVTVVIPTFQRHVHLAECLVAISAGARPPDRRLVVTRPDDLRSIEVAEAAGAEVALVLEPGLAQAIDCALSNVETDVIAFIDDDARAHPEWVERIAAHFEADEHLGFLGGRDHVRGDREAGTESLLVGVLRWGKVIGNHHLGKGPARRVAHVKGANMSFRLAAVKGLPLGRLVAGAGAQHRNELFLSLAATRAGFVGVYDPSVQVDHFPGERAQGDQRREFPPERVRNDIRNTIVAIGLFLPRIRLISNIARTLLVGDRDRPGLAWAFRGKYGGFRATLKGVDEGLRALPAMRRLVDQSPWGAQFISHATPAPGVPRGEHA